MTTTKGIALLAFAALALAACDQSSNDMGAPMPSGGGSAGAAGPGYCDSPPTDMAEMSQWEEMCQPERG